MFVNVLVAAMLNPSKAQMNLRRLVFQLQELARRSRVVFRLFIEGDEPWKATAANR
jgi:hypothetical protein